MQLEAITRAANLPPAKYVQSHLSSADCRNQIVKWLMEETTDDVIMCDDDAIPPLDILKLAEHGKDIVASPTMITQAAVNLSFFNVYRAEGEGYMPLDMQFSLRGLHKADAVGMGAIFLSRRVLHRLKPAFDFTSDEWGVMVRSEDMAFCEKARGAGFDIWADFDLQCEHVSTVGLLAQHVKFMAAVGKAIEASRR